ncbi:hypothetical protein BVI1335_70099 [Burkholderia vietnamiensis]|nr:hypothetical protein BVI1335_70099 [Burkholderia vietnamiensis]
MGAWISYEMLGLNTFWMFPCRELILVSWFFIKQGLTRFLALLCGSRHSVRKKKDSLPRPFD